MDPLARDIQEEVATQETRRPRGYRLQDDKKDVLIVKELEKNARKTFAELAPLLGVSLQGVKYLFDKKLVPLGIVRNFQFDVIPYPMELAAYHEIMLEFRNSRAMNKFYSLVDELFFVLGVSKVLRRDTLFVRTHVLQS